MNRKNKDLRVVRDSEDVDKLVRRIMDNTEDEETQMAQLEEQVKAHKKENQNKNSDSSHIDYGSFCRNLFIYTFTDVYECAGGEHLSGGRKYGQQLQRNFQKVCFVTVEMEWHI